MVQQWKAGNTLIEVAEGDENFGPCSIAGCDDPSIWRAAGTQRCANHASNTNVALGQHKPPEEM